MTGWSRPSLSPLAIRNSTGITYLAGGAGDGNADGCFGWCSSRSPGWGRPAPRENARWRRPAKSSRCALRHRAELTLPGGTPGLASDTSVSTRTPVVVQSDDARDRVRACRRTPVKPSFSPLYRQIKALLVAGLQAATGSRGGRFPSRPNSPVATASPMNSAPGHRRDGSRDLLVDARARALRRPPRRGVDAVPLPRLMPDLGDAAALQRRFARLPPRPRAGASRVLLRLPARESAVQVRRLLLRDPR